MLFQQIEQNRSYADAIVTPRESVSWPVLCDRAAALRDQWQSLRSRRVGLAVSSDADAIAAMAALDAVQADVTLFDEVLSEADRRALAERLNWLAWLVPPIRPSDPWQVINHDGSNDSVSPGVTILTSGTEGVPKAVQHTWQTLFRPVRATRGAERARWLLAYRLNLYAGLQVIAQSIASAGCLVIPGPELPVADALRLIRLAGVTHASATPSYWRRLLLFSDPEWWRDLSVRQVTIGGEAVDQALLDQLRAVLPDARIAHIYATTELGRCFSVTDGRQGFPLDYLQLDRFPDVRLKIDDGELYVQSQNRGAMHRAGETGGSPSHSGQESWRPTGDLVEVVADRVLFRGRRGDMINVGGNKVQPLRVEEVVRGVEGVRDCLVLGKPSSIAGHLVACQIVLDDPSSAESVRQHVLEQCHQRLQRHEVPRIIEFVETIEMTNAGKRTRVQH